MAPRGYALESAGARARGRPPFRPFLSSKRLVSRRFAPWPPQMQALAIFKRRMTGIYQRCDAKHSVNLRLDSARLNGATTAQDQQAAQQQREPTGRGGGVGLGDRLRMTHDI